MERQQELTRRIQERLQAAAEKVGQQRKQLGPPAVPAPASRRMTSSGLCAGWCVEMTGGAVNPPACVRSERALEKLALE